MIRRNIIGGSYFQISAFNFWKFKFPDFSFYIITFFLNKILNLDFLLSICLIWNAEIQFSYIGGRNFKISAFNDIS